MRILCNLYHLRGERFRARQSSSGAPHRRGEVSRSTTIVQEESFPFNGACEVLVHGTTGEVNDFVYYVRVFVIPTSIILGYFFFYVYPATPSKLQ